MRSVFISIYKARKTRSTLKKYNLNFNLLYFELHLFIKYYSFLMELLYFKNKFNLLKSEFFCVLTHHLIILMTL